MYFIALSIAELRRSDMHRRLYDARAGRNSTLPRKNRPAAKSSA